MSLKIAISGKGGVGKTTTAGLISRLLASRGKRVIAIDADPVANMVAVLGMDDGEPIVPISHLSDLIAERTGSQPGTFGGVFKMNPKVDDIPDTLSREKDGVKLLVMGTVDHGGGGCVCPESVVLKSLMNHLILFRDDIVVVDMEAGVEHLGRATVGSVDRLIIIVDPGARSHTAAKQIRKLAADIGLNKVAIIGNRVRGEEDIERIKTSLSDFEFLGFVGIDEEIADADRDARQPFIDSLDKMPQGLIDIVDRLEELSDK